MTKVSMLWRAATMMVIGIVIGIFITIKYISPPSGDIEIGRVVIKGRNNTVNDMLDVTNIKEVKVDTTLNFWQYRRLKRATK